MRRAVFLDRDGIFNEVVVRDGKLSAPWKLEEFIFLPRVREAVQLLQQAGFLCVVITNQQAIGHGKFSEAELERMHELLRRETGIEILYYCPHRESDGCSCLKPAPGMVEQAAEEHNIDVANSFVVGDRWRDILLGEAVGCPTVLISTRATQMDGRELHPTHVAADLWEAAQWIVRQA